MSRIGKKEIKIPEGVEIKIADNLFTAKGPKGELSLQLHPKIKLAKEENSLRVSVENPEIKREKSLWGTFGKLVYNVVFGVSKGYEKQLELKGVGYRASLSQNKLVLNVGFSHPVEFILPSGIEAKIEKNTIIISGIDKQLVGETAARIRRIRKPEPYKGTGIKYVDEIIRKKAGKKAISSA